MSDEPKVRHVPPVISSYCWWSEYILRNLWMWHVYPARIGCIHSIPDV